MKLYVYTAERYMYHQIYIYTYIYIGYAWAEDKEHCEEYGRMLQANPMKVSKRAKIRGLPQLGTLGAGNHYCEIQVVEDIYDKFAANRMGIEGIGQVCIMIHSGSRGALILFRILYPTIISF